MKFGGIRQPQPTYGVNQFTTIVDHNEFAAFRTEAYAHAVVGNDPPVRCVDDLNGRQLIEWMKQREDLRSLAVPRSDPLQKDALICRPDSLYIEWYVGDEVLPIVTECV